MPKTRGAYLVMTAALELREEGFDEGFAIIALGHALFAEERLEPAHGVPGTLWGSQRSQRLRGKVEEATERACHTHTYTEAARIQPFPAIHHVLHRNIPSVVVLCYNSGTCVRVLHRPDVFQCLCVPTHDAGIVILGMTNCSTDRRSRRSARTSGGSSRPGIRGWRVSGSLHELADEIGAGVHFGGCAGGSTSRTTCTARGPDVSCSRLGGGCGHSILDYKWAL